MKSAHQPQSTACSGKSSLENLVLIDCLGKAIGYLRYFYPRDTSVECVTHWNSFTTQCMAKIVENWSSHAEIAAKEQEEASMAEEKEELEVGEVVGSSQKNTKEEVPISFSKYSSSSMSEISVSTMTRIQSTLSSLLKGNVAHDDVTFEIRKINNHHNTTEIKKKMKRQKESTNADDDEEEGDEQKKLATTSLRKEEQKEVTTTSSSSENNSKFTSSSDDAYFFYHRGVAKGHEGASSVYRSYRLTSIQKLRSRHLPNNRKADDWSVPSLQTPLHNAILYQGSYCQLIMVFPLAISSSKDTLPNKKIMRDYDAYVSNLSSQVEDVDAVLYQDKVALAEKIPFSTASRLAGVALLSATLTHFFPYFDCIPDSNVSIMMTSASLEEHDDNVGGNSLTPLHFATLQAYEEALTSPSILSYWMCLQHFTHYLNDGHVEVQGSCVQQTLGAYYPFDLTTLLPPSSSSSESPTVVVTAVNQYCAGLQVGDVLVKYNGVPMAQVLKDYRQLVSSATEAWAQSKNLQLLARGTGPLEIEVARYRIMAPVESSCCKIGEKQPAAPLSSSSNFPSATNSFLEGLQLQQVLSLTLSPEKLSHMASEPKLNNGIEVGLKSEGIRYYNLDRHSCSEREWDKLLPIFAHQDCHGIIFDLRGYPNSVSKKVLRHLIPSTTTATQQQRAPIVSAFWSTPITIFPDVQKEEGKLFNTSTWEALEPREPCLCQASTSKKKRSIVFITDRTAISYAESILNFIEYYQFGVLVGEQSAGTNGNMNKTVLPCGFQVYWTGMKVTRQDGKQHHGVGIQPAVIVSRTVRGILEGRDEFLEAAIEICRQQQK